VTLPLLPQLFVIDNLNQIEYAPETKSLMLQITRREKNSEYLMFVEIRTMALREIVLALQKFATDTGTTIEGLTTPASFQ
jgi:hypothetical protein